MEPDHRPRRHRRNRVLVLAALAATAAFRPGAAPAALAAWPDAVDDESPVPPEPPPSAKMKQWYGGQVLAADLMGIMGGWMCGMMTGSGNCIALLPIAAPILHAVGHDRPGQAALSLGLHLGLPIAGAIIGARLESCGPDEDLCGLGGATLGVLVGLVAATVIDAALSYDEVPLPSPRYAAVRRRPAGPTVAPAISYLPGNATLGLRGTF